MASPTLILQMINQPFQHNMRMFHEIRKDGFLPHSNSFGFRKRYCCRFAIRAIKRGFGSDSETNESSVNFNSDLVKSSSGPSDKEFELRLNELKKEAINKKDKKLEDTFATINYEAPLDTEKKEGENSTLKVGAGIAAVIFAAIFILGEFSPQTPVTSEGSRYETELSPKEKANLQLQVKRFETMLESNSNDLSSLEGLAVSYAELGEYAKAAETLEKLLELAPANAEAIRLLAEVYYFQGKYDDSAEKYRSAIQAYPQESVTLLQGLVDTLIAGGNPQQGLEEAKASKSRVEKESVEDKIPFDLLVARALVANGNYEEADALYDKLIAEKSEDFRAYVAKAVLLKGQGRKTDAEKLFLKARFLAPGDSKAVVDSIARL